MSGFAIVISYRREDSRAASNAIYHELVRRFGQGSVLFDLTEIPVGQAYDEFVRGIISRAKALVVVIGPHWLEAKKKGRRRLDLEDDSVRGEITAALQEGVTVIPLLVDGAEAPDIDVLPVPLKPLARLNMLPIADRYWAADMDLLSERLAALVKPATASNSWPRGTKIVASAAAFVAVLAVVSGIFLAIPNIKGTWRLNGDGDSYVLTQSGTSILGRSTHIDGTHGSVKGTVLWKTLELTESGVFGPPPPGRRYTANIRCTLESGNRCFGAIDYRRPYVTTFPWHAYKNQ